MLKLLPLILVLWIAGCSSLSPVTPSTKYYLLDEFPSKVTAQRPKAINIQLTNIKVPDYLNQSNLVMKKNNQELLFANYHNWADNLPQAIQKVVIQSLNTANPDIGYNTYCQATSCPQLRISIDHFYPTESGDVVLAGAYSIVGKKSAIHHQTFVLSKSLEQGGYNESVKQMRALLRELANAIQSQVSVQKNGHPNGGHESQSIQNTGVVF